MEAGTRCRISGLQSRPDLNGLEGEALYLRGSGRYLVHVDKTDEQLNIKATNLTACQHVEELSAGDLNIAEATITVNGLLYCAQHRMEICGACSYNFRVLNLMRQLKPGDDNYERACKADDDEMTRDEPPRRAPLKGGDKAPEPASVPVPSPLALPTKGLA